MFIVKFPCGNRETLVTVAKLRPEKKAFKWKCTDPSPNSKIKRFLALRLILLQNQNILKHLLLLYHIN